MFWSRTSAISEARHVWPALVILLLAVLAPTLCVLWFMNEAVSNERFAIRQRLQDLYQQELTIRQKRLDGHWENAIEALGASRDKEPLAAFFELVHNGFTSALIYRDGRLAYPILAAATTAASPQSDGRWQEAQSLEQAGQYSPAADAYAVVAGSLDTNIRAAAQIAQMRTLFRSGQTSQALAVLSGALQAPEIQGSTDAAGRLLIPSALFLAIDSLPPESAARPSLIRQLADRLRQYSGPPMPSAQRLFLMEQLRQLAAENFPTMAAERLALQIAESYPQAGVFHWASQDAANIQPIPGFPTIWMIADGSGNAIGLWSNAALHEQWDSLLQSDAPAATTIALLEPGAHESGNSFLKMRAGRYMPGWNLVLSLQGPDPFSVTAKRREAAYLWTGCLSIAAIAALASILGVYLRRQMRLTRLRNDLIATVSHELKTPLSSMRVLIDTLLEGRIPRAQNQREYLALIARENTRLSRLIDNFLAFSRMERGKVAFEFHAVTIDDIARAALEAMGERAAMVRADIAPRLTLSGDADALVTLLLNLLDNAWKYSREDKRIELTAMQADYLIEITVRDHGIGIARRHQRRIFQRFFQVDRELSRQTGGCGLGLAIVQFIAKAHRGTVTVTSQPGHGSTFRVLLPRIPSAPSLPPAEGASLAIAEGSTHSHG